MIRCLICSFCTLLVCSTAARLAASEPDANDFEPAENAAWILIGPDSVMFVKNREEAAKLTDQEEAKWFVVTCEEFQVHGHRTEGKTGMQLECSNVTAFQFDRTEVGDDKFLIAKATCLKYDSLTQTLELVGKDQAPVRIVSHQSETQTIKIEATTARIHFDSTGHRLEINSAQLLFESRIETKDQSSEQTASTEPVKVLYFKADWSGPCREMNPVVAKLMLEGMPFEVVDITMSPTAAKTHEVTVVPQFLFLKNGKQVEQLTGVQTETTLKSTFTAIETGKPNPTTETPDLCCAGKGNPSSTCLCAPKPMPEQSVRGSGQEFRLIEFVRPAIEPESEVAPADTNEKQSQFFEALWPEVFESKASSSAPKTFIVISRDKQPLSWEHFNSNWPLLLDDTKPDEPQKYYQFGGVEIRR